MMQAAYLMYCAALALLAFPAAWWLCQKLAVAGGLLHFAYVCFFFPFFAGFLTSVLWPMTIPLSNELALMDSGAMADPGPLAFAQWARWLGIPLLLYAVFSVPLFLIARKRMTS